MVSKEDLKAVVAGKPVKKTIAKKTKAKPKPKTISKTAFTDHQFAHALIEHSMNPTAAYRSLKPHVANTTANTEGRKHLRKPSVIAILTPLIQKLFTEAGITSEWVMRRWVEMSIASPLDYFEVEPNGQLGQLNLNGITDAQRINLKEIKVERTMIEKTDPEGEVTHAIVSEKINLKVADQQKAVDTIAKHLGLLMDRLADEDVDKIGDLIEQGVARIRASKDLDGWKSITFEGELDRK